MQGNTILLKQDNGSYQLLRISSAQPGTQVTPGLTPTGGSTIRLQTVPAVSRFPGPTLALRKTILTQQVKQNKQNVNSHHVWIKTKFSSFFISYGFKDLISRILVYVLRMISPNLIILCERISISSEHDSHGRCFNGVDYDFDCVERRTEIVSPVVRLRSRFFEFHFFNRSFWCMWSHFDDRLLTFSCSFVVLDGTQQHSLCDDVFS